MAKSSRKGAAGFLPVRPTLSSAGKAIQCCQGCDLYRFATQAVFGEGPRHSSILFVGEQPGNDEDRQGHPFVGPAGKLLNRALADAGISRSDVYVTNAVKHFKFEKRGKRRIHKKPRASEIEACRPWLDVEIGLIRPQIVVCLGATASQALMGNGFRLTKERGNFFDKPGGGFVTATVHPSAILRAPDEQQRHAQYREFVADLKAIRERLRRIPAPSNREPLAEPAGAPTS